MGKRIIISNLRELNGMTSNWHEVHLYCYRLRSVDFRLNSMHVAVKSKAENREKFIESAAKPRNFRSNVQDSMFWNDRAEYPALLQRNPTFVRSTVPNSVFVFILR